MKKQFLLLITIAAFTGKTMAQETFMDVVINYTPTSINYGDNNKELKDFKKGYWGLQAGASFQAGITEYFSLVPELYFVMKGGRLENNNPLTGQETKIRFNTLDLPVMARLHLCNLYVNAGPVISYNINGRLKTQSNGNLPGGKSKMEFGSELGTYSRWDAGLQFGMGYEFKLKKTRLLLDLRYHYGMVDIGNGADMYNRYFNMNILLSKKWKTNPLGKKKSRDLAFWEAYDEQLANPFK
ncbi:MAG: porin family protein [Arenibacter sp.]